MRQLRFGASRPWCLTTDPEMVWDDPPSPTLTSTTVQGGYALQHMPWITQVHEFTWYAGIVNADGTVTPLTADGTPAP